MQALLGEQPRRRDLLIEFLHLLQDRIGCLHARHLAALAQEMKLALVEVYEVASFYAHFDIVMDGETPPPPLTVRVCDSLTCELMGARSSAEGAAGEARRRACAWCARPAWAAATTRRSTALGHALHEHATRRRASPPRSPRARRIRMLPPYRDLDAYRADGGYRLLRGLPRAARRRSRRC